jgi:hypothetical protein
MHRRTFRVLICVLLAVCVLYGGVYIAAEAGNADPSGEISVPASAGIGGAFPMSWSSLTLIIMGLLLAMFRKSTGNQKGMIDFRKIYADLTRKPVSLSALEQQDPAFDESSLAQKLACDCAHIQHACTDEAVQPMRMLMTPGMYRRFLRKLAPYRKKGRTRHIEQLEVLKIHITDCLQDRRNHYLRVEVRVRMIDYDVDDATQAVVRGSKDQEIYMNYEWILKRAKACKTRKDGRLICAHCSAALIMTECCTCSNCRQRVRLVDHSWAISDIKLLSTH